MDQAALAAWAKDVADGEVVAKADYSLSLTSKLLRFRWNGAPTVGVGSDADGSTRIQTVVDGLAWVLATRDVGDDALHLVLGVPSKQTSHGFAEHSDAIGTLISQLTDGPQIRLWTVGDDGAATEIEVQPAAFTTGTPAKWSSLLASAAESAVDGVAAELVREVGHPSLALYPKLSSRTGPEPWQLRVDGLEIGRAGTGSATLALNSGRLDSAREPRATWREVVGAAPVFVSPASIPTATALIRAVIKRWSDADNPGAVLAHGHAEHALEAHILSGRLTLLSDGGPLRSAVPHRTTLRAAQFPTLWGDVTRPARYLDALLADGAGRPWAVELKDQDAGGGHGAYLRHGITQAVLYRHYIRTAPALDDWFSNLGLDQSRCQAALAFPTAASAAAKSVEKHRDLARRWDVEVMEFSRPGSVDPLGG